MQNARKGSLKMRSISQLSFGFNDAVNYKYANNREILDQIFFHIPLVTERLLEPQIFFLLGEKGTGKTAHAIYMVNHPLAEDKTHGKQGTSFNNCNLTESEYRKFVTMKTAGQLGYSSYTDVWSVILYLLLANQIKEAEIVNRAPITNRLKFSQLRSAIDEFYNHAFAPEIGQALLLVENSELALNLLSPNGGVEGKKSVNLTSPENRVQLNLVNIKRQFEDALGSVKLTRNHTLFIDGIDVRPVDIKYDDYLECVKGLALAVWQINTEFFPRISGSTGGKLKAVLLLRPDIFNRLNLQNQNSKVRDNSVVLDWRTTYADFRTSSLFKVIGRMLSNGQSDTLEEDESWDAYFPYKLYNKEDDEYSDSSFIGFLRMSLYRPRDIITMLVSLKQLKISKGQDRANSFEISDFEANSFLNEYSTYLLGEIKDQLTFYYKHEDYELFLRFFMYLNGKSTFSYSEFVDAYSDLIQHINNTKSDKPNFLSSQDEFLQFLYDLNVCVILILMILADVFSCWCFRERTLTSFAPKVRIGAQEYQIHSGLRRELNLTNKGYKPSSSN